MKQISVLSLLLFIINISWAQENALKITNSVSGKEIIIKENKRIKIKTTEGKKISGRFTRSDNKSIFLKGEEIVLQDILEIKRNPLLLSIFSSGFFIYVGAITAGFGVIIGALIDSTAFWLTIPGAAMIYTGIKSPNFLRKFKRDKNWTFEWIAIPPAS
ncbi:hypothetical protein AB8P51_00945 [Muriicola sp. SD30]|uniref:hypothetical protein n=1 Tax=Muriicola sp. SD30 TaxID=3240936 RepID=UPI00350EACB2